MGRTRELALKSGTLLLFAGLIVGFVAYQSGYMTQRTFATSPNGGVLRSMSDSIPDRDSLMRSRELLISSSKTMIIKPPPAKAIIAGRNPAIGTDSILKLTLSPLRDSSIARADQLLIVRKDTIVQDSIKQE